MKATNIQEALATAGKAFKILSPRERKILRLRYGLDDGNPRTLEQIATIEKVTRERIRQLESVALEKINLVIKYDE